MNTTKNKNKVIILGSGCASGVPMVSTIPGGDWGECDPKNPKNLRTRPSIYLEYEGTRILVDTSPDFRAQYLRNGLTGIDAVILTHAHSDHISGIDDLRKISIAQGGPIPIYATEETFKTVEGTYGHLFKSHPDYNIYPKILQKNIVEGDFLIKGHLINVYVQPHSDIDSLGLRFGDLAYSTDFRELNAPILESLKGIKTWIMDCLAIYGKKPTHSTLEQNLKYIDIVKPERVYLSHMARYVDYDFVSSLLPKGVFASHDTLKIDF